MTPREKELLSLLQAQAEYLESQAARLRGYAAIDAHAKAGLTASFINRAALLRERLTRLEGAQ